MKFTLYGRCAALALSVGLVAGCDQVPELAALMEQRSEQTATTRSAASAPQRAASQRAASQRQAPVVQAQSQLGSGFEPADDDTPSEPASAPEPEPDFGNGGFGDPSPPGDGNVSWN